VIDLTQLRDIAEIEREGVDPSEIDSDTPYVGLDAIGSDGSISKVITSGQAGLASTKFRFSERHILFGKLRPYLRKVARPSFSGICSTDIIPIIPSARVDRNYLFHFLRSDGVIDRATSMSSGANLPRISPHVLAQFEIPLPSLDEQRRIATILDQAGALLRKRNAAMALFERIPAALYNSIFGDPVSNLKNWPCSKLSKVSLFENGDRSANYPSGDDIVTKGIPFLSGRNFVDDTLDWTSTSFITAEKFRSLSRGKAIYGDLIITLRGSLANCCEFRGPYESAFINAQMMIIRPLEGAVSSFLHSTLIHPSVRQKILEMSSGVAVPQLTAKQLADVLVPIPPKPLQEAYVKKLQTIRATRTKLALHGSRLKALLDALQNRFFGSGVCLPLVERLREAAE
jgi:type I restriction enzyme S subunit